MYARSDFERIFLACIFLFGVLIFSVILNNFLIILDKITLINSDLDDGDQLTLFFGLLKRFNSGSKLDHNLVVKIEKFFDYKWNHDKLQAIDDESEIAILNQLPAEI